MAEKNDPRSNVPPSGKPQQRPTRIFDAETDVAMSVTNGRNAPADFDSVIKKRANSEPWIKKNAMLVTLSGSGAAIVVFFVIIGWLMGWFSGPTESPAQAAAATAPKAQTPTPVAPVTPVQQPAKAPEEKKEEPKKPEKPPLPADVAKWKKPEYFRARRENDPKLIEAVKYLGKTFVGSKQTAEGLTKLLGPPEAEKQPAKETPNADKSPIPGPSPIPSPTPQPKPTPTPTAPPANQAELTKLVEAIVDALGANGTETARATLEKILAGTLKTDDDKAAVEAAVKTLAAHASAENDALLLRVLTDAVALRSKAHQGPWPARELQTKALEWIKADISFDLRTNLAETLAAKRAFFAREPMGEFLLANDPRNCGAQLALYKATTISAEVKDVIERQLVDYSSKAMADYLGVPEDAMPKAGGGTAASVPVPHLGVGGTTGQPNADAKKPPAVNWAPRIAGLLWSDDFLGWLEPKLGPSSLERQPSMLLLAGTIPRYSARAILMKVFKKRWSEGPRTLEAAGLLDRAVTDPGFLVVMKLGGKRSDTTATTKPSNGASARPARGTVPVTGPKAAEAAAKLKTEQDWMDVSVKMVDAWRKRLYAAAQAKEKAAEKSDRSDEDAMADTKLPDGFQLSPKAVVKAAYHLSWPDDAPPDLAKLNPSLLDVYYIRAEETSQIKKLEGYYSRTQGKLRPNETRMLDKSLWIDSLRTATQKDRRRSLDILITRTSGGTGNIYENNDEADFLVEVLIVEIKDPGKE